MEYQSSVSRAVPPVGTGLWRSSPVPSQKPPRLFPGVSTGRPEASVNVGTSFNWVFPAFTHASINPPTDETILVAADSRPVRYAQAAALWDRIEEFARMPDGWAGEGSVAVSREVLLHIGRLLSELPADIELPQATASADGEIGLTWFKGSDRLDAILGSVSYLSWASRVGEIYFEGDVVELSFDAPLTRFHEALAQFCG